MRGWVFSVGSQRCRNIDVVYQEPQLDRQLRNAHTLGKVLNHLVEDDLAIDEGLQVDILNFFVWIW